MDIAVSPATKAIGQKYGKTPTPQFEKDLEALEKSGDASAAVLLGELEDPILHTPELVRFREDLSKLSETFPQLLDSLDRLLARYPVIGSRDAKLGRGVARSA